MDVGKATELVTIIFARMNKDQRRSLIKLLKMARSKLDFSYPNGMQAAPVAATDSLILPE